MRKLLVPALLLFAACKKDDTTVSQRPYDGKWYIHHVINKKYTIENGDTTFSRYNVITGTGREYVEFPVSSSTPTEVFIQWSSGSSQMTYEPVTPSFFKLDDYMCEITQLTDSSLHFNGIYFDGESTPGKVEVLQNFYTLGR
ncbi:hypothetical protein [Chitinophaga agri]|uniref:Lipocalin-like domain-containing protein n=1 Tax=Chitinophaga agri TaxID=2703787 RepID=A0A6B9Z8W1_9BACT|nr:hypothetical protein [Chitinophaga agri]QHS58698.1 hypothetical protein GWR21_03500 [Chitinophaga agri]